MSPETTRLMERAQAVKQRAAERAERSRLSQDLEHLERLIAAERRALGLPPRDLDLTAALSNGRRPAAHA